MHTSKVPIIIIKKVDAHPGNNVVIINNSNSLPQNMKEIIINELQIYGLKILDDCQFPQYVKDKNGITINLMKKLGPILGKYIKLDSHVSEVRVMSINSYEPINFNYVFSCAKRFADYLRQNQGKIIHCLQRYECFNVAVDEIKRSIDLLENLDQNVEYFKARVNRVVSFLPLNQPLYSSICFGSVVSLMARATIMRPPTLMQNMFKDLETILQFCSFFPNLIVSYDDKNEFIQKNKEIADVVIFTGMYHNAQKVKKGFKKDVLFIFNGAGHNPIVISKDADVNKAVNSICRVCLQNQGQDCAAPNAILVHSQILNAIIKKCNDQLNSIQNFIGDYSNYNNIIGPNTDCAHALKIARILYDNRRFLQYGGEVNIATGLIKPTVFVKPLLEGGNFSEFFAPVIMLQPYDKDEDLKMYFEHSNYKPHAMYVTLFGTSKYVETLIEKGLHTKENILRDTDLHIEERGFKPYGGLGIEASCIHFNNKAMPGATLPQRDIYTYLVYPSLEKNMKNLAMQS